MNTTLKIGDIVYFLESNKNAIPVEIISIRNGFCVIRFPNGKSGTRVRDTKVFKSEEEALLNRISTKYYANY